MYSKESWGGAVDPYIEVSFQKQDGTDAVASVIIYEWKDFSLIGRPHPEQPDKVRLQDAKSKSWTWRSATVY